jgi:hypothetical protein
MQRGQALEVGVDGQRLHDQMTISSA